MMPYSINDGDETEVCCSFWLFVFAGGDKMLEVDVIVIVQQRQKAERLET